MAAREEKKEPAGHDYDASAPYDPEFQDFNLEKKEWNLSQKEKDDFTRYTRFGYVHGLPIPIDTLYAWMDSDPTLGPARNSTVSPEA